MIKEIEIIGLFGEMDIKLPLTGKNSLSENSDVVVLIGENGSGKTTVLNILNSLMNLDKPGKNLDKISNLIFKEVIIKTVNNKFTITSELVKAFINVIKLTGGINKEVQLLLLKNNISENDINKLSNENKANYELILKNKDKITLFADLSIEFNKFNKGMLFFPTYRRIENNIQLSKDSKKILQNENMFFGMNDIENLINNSVGKVKTVSSIGFEEIRTLLSEMKTSKNPEEISKKIEEVDKKNSKEFNKLKHFVDTCNKYLFRKEIIFIPEKFELYIEKENKKRVSLDNLSSGEKQMVSIFAQLYLKDDKDLIIIFDEPELSISVEWQKMLLPDMLKSNKIKQLIVATHSPSIFHDDELFKNTIDIHDHITYISADDD